MSDKIKYFSSTHVNVTPSTMTCAAGQLTAVLQACLVDGYNYRTTTGGITVVGTTATINGLPVGHGYDTTQVILVSNSSNSSLNGEWNVVSAGSTTVSFTVSGGTLSDGSSNTITVKVAPLGWANAFPTIGNVACFRSQNNTASNKMFLRVDDNQSYMAKVWGCESMSDLNTPNLGYGVFPGTPTAFTHTWSWYKGSTYNGNTSTAVDWVLIGNDKTFFFLPTCYGYHASYYTTNGRAVYGFGDLNSYKAADAYSTFLMADTQTSASVLYYTGEGAGLSIYGLAGGNYGAGQCIARNWSSLGSFVPMYKSSLACNLGSFTGGMISGSSSNYIQVPFPNLPDNSLIIHPTYAFEPGFYLRGVLPGNFTVLNQQPLSDRALVSAVTGYPGRNFILLSCYCGASSATPDVTSRGRVAFDMTGPW